MDTLPDDVFIFLYIPSRHCTIWTHSLFSLQYCWCGFDFVPVQVVDIVLSHWKASLFQRVERSLPPPSSQNVALSREFLSAESQTQPPYNGAVSSNLLSRFDIPCMYTVFKAYYAAMHCIYLIFFFSFLPQGWGWWVQKGVSVLARFLTGVHFQTSLGDEMKRNNFLSTCLEQRVFQHFWTLLRHFCGFSWFFFSSSHI